MKTRRYGLGAIMVFGLASSLGSMADVLDDAAYRDWVGERQVKELDDGSVITEYLANTVARGRADAALTLAFMPRFECTPLIGIRIASEVTDDAEQTAALLRSLRLLKDGDRLTLQVNDRRVPYPVLVDWSNEQAALWYGEDREDRETLTLQMDGGDRAQIALSDATTLEFSLLGSRKSVRAVRENCLKHEPVPYKSP